MIEELIAEILESLPAHSWAGSVYRVMLGDYPPDRENIVGARWNPPDIPAIYVSESEATAIAEVNYRLALQTRPVRQDLKRTLYRIDVQLSAVIDVDAALPQLAAAGIRQEHLFGPDQNVSQGIGKMATWLDRDALRVPSARATGCNLVIFPDWAKEGEYKFEAVSKRIL